MFFIRLAEESAVAPNLAEREVQLGVEPGHGEKHEGGVGLVLREEGVVYDESLAGFAEPEFVAKFHGGTGFAALEDAHVFIVELRIFSARGT